MAESREFAAAASECSTAYALYIMRAAAHAARSGQLFEQVIGCVARRQLSPEALEGSLTTFLTAHESAMAVEVQGAVARFVAALEASVILSTEIVTSYRSRIDSVIAGDATPDEQRRAIRKDYNRGVSREISRLATCWFELLGALDDVRAKATEQYLLEALRSATPIGLGGDRVELAGRLKSTASTTVSLENTRQERVLLRCTVSDVRRADAIGPSFVPKIVLTPSEIVLEAERTANLGVSLWLDETIFESGTRYVGSLHISRDGGDRQDVPLSIAPMPSLMS